MILSFRSWLLLKENIEGEYWIMDGFAMGADGNVNDFTHEGYAIMNAQSEIVQMAVDESFVDWKKYQNIDDYGVDWSEFERDLVKGYVEHKPELEELSDEDPDQVLAMVWQEMGVDEELLMIATDRGDVRNLAMKRWGWKAARGNYIQTWTLTKSDLNSIANGLDEIYHGDKNLEVEIEVMSTGKSYDVPISVVNTGDPMKVMTWNGGQETQGVKNAYNQALNQIDKPESPYYKDWN